MMIGERNVPKQFCPLCNEPQDLIVNGHMPSENPEKLHIVKDQGYSFCNCNNIFFTDWKNIEQSIYDDKYTKKYDAENVNKAIKHYWEAYKDVILKHHKNGKVLEVGCINPALLDEFSKWGFETYSLDIIPHSHRGHQNITSDFEKFDNEEKFDIIWASHVFEHFKNPLKAVDSAYRILNQDGLFFVSMPDPYFIEWKSPYSWGHWHLGEHHIMWDMDSFKDILKQKGFEIIFAKHNVEMGFICWSDWHILAKKI